ncbi:XRE family transcriptional regulator (plasmid) [Rhizobium ruizarguesonis]|uniref:XRE family transcriptional regulator n=2 Tax=Rhizobium ruizarguesonis TaxID=2081791 RepID=A0ABY1X1S3_9HYPH|nr:LacI family DNA-binding transcriptional regulator [Rhizobium ruizarguesonis]NKK73266.1 LacI family DNA-binding transcriptional regulator [Rhizobium leguminosarum bv. viciae]NKL12278.1 LacI family DNA-binding transcriptional regulator [Rhizobium leguminosarum bv. viciae]TAU17627.1 XRE family transcriptional regulator [Rhizobium ruizarguesonis]TAU59489.1 XRE family transcriptional regulator [Rhizobium ruizarguesonis]TAU72005.1 XRE family transcriptional regulator [Rhizobium ruizarguesonis]
MLKLGVREVAELAKVTANTVSRVEQDDAGPRGPQPVTIDAIKRVYEERGIIFFEEGSAPNGGKGVRLTR